MDVSKTIFECCIPWPEVLGDDDPVFSADAAKVTLQTAPREYSNVIEFFRQTYPTRGLQTLVVALNRRLFGGPECAPAVGLRGKYGGGKTHGLVAALHVAEGWRKVASGGALWKLERKSDAKARVVVLDGERSNPIDGALLESGVRAYSPWQELAFRMGNWRAFQAFADGDRLGKTPSVADIRELFQDNATLILIDSLKLELRRAERARPGYREQLLAFVVGLFEAVASTRNCALVYTLPFNVDDPDRDPYSRENRELAEAIDQAEARLSFAPLHVTPIEADEALDVVRRRLFVQIEPPPNLARTENQQLSWTYPLHPTTVDLLRRKISSSNTSQSIRGTLRVLTTTVRRLWHEGPQNATLIEPQHLDFSGEIKRLAYYYWERAGRPDGSAETDWRRAEQAFS